ncbi:hypothetical protein [Nocardioides sp. AE5]|uniref:hypothetical protein n=1 Tax=Nocardioides sp. AE5 TaxID=2962573 RepID=UPI002881ED25|nr:hypothetical protein [Nocardioides sp. AE5]MDT0203194.1 hypothetical protein [Nocardioides sp. AE5]
MTFVVEGLVRFPVGDPVTVDRFTQEFAEVELPVVMSSGLGLTGAWAVADPEGPLLLHLYGPLAGLAELTASGRKMAQLPADHPYNGLYAWITGADIRYTRTVRPVIARGERSARDPRGDGPDAEIHVIATTRYGITGAATVRPVVAAAVHDLASTGTPVHIAYDTLFGDHGSTRLIGAAPTLEAFAAEVEALTASTASERDPWTFVEATPLPYSPLR